jgi:hypothetical protein
MTDRIQQSREYLIDFMRINFTDKTFDNYIENTLAGDFACELATIIERMRRKRDDRMNQCRGHDTRRAAAVAQAASLAAEVERLNAIISRLSVEGQDAVEM